MKSLKVNALANMLLKILNIVFPLITTPYITRLLNPNDYASFNNANTYMNLFVPIAAFGIYNYGIREISNNKENKQKVNQIFSKLFYTGLITALITFIIYIIIIINKNISNYNMYFILGFQILFQFMYIEWINEAVENYTFILYKTLFIRFSMLISIFLFVKEERDIIPYTLIMTISTIANFILSFLWIKREIKFIKVKFTEIINTIIILIPVFCLANVNMLYTVLDRVFLEYSHNKIDISYYTLSQTLVTIISGVIYGAISVNIPRLSYYLGKKDKKAYYNLLTTGTNYFMFIMMPICTGLIILGKYSMLIAFGDKYKEGGILVTIFAFRTIFWSIEVILGQQIIFTNGYEKKLITFYFIGGLINMIFNTIILLKNIISPDIILLTTIIAEITVVLLEIIFIIRNKIVNIKPFLKTTIKYFLISLFFIPIYFIFKKYLYFEYIINIYLIINIIIFILTCIFIYFSILLLIKDKIIYDIINYVIKKHKKV